MPQARADVLPAALTTILAIAEMGGLHAFRHSLYNLRWGVADELLGSN
jgi:exopolyphosphatase/guanosine-5'-triphosphate,3'-diphosphate pyrophosphatase